MAQVSRVDRSVSPPLVQVPRDFNAAHDLIERNLAGGRAAKLAYIDDRDRYTFEELARRVDRFAHALCELDVRQEERILLCLLDTIDFPTTFLGAIKAGLVPVAANTLLTSADYAYLLRDSRARVLVVSHRLWAQFETIVKGAATLRHIVISEGQVPGTTHLAELLSRSDAPFAAAQTTCDDPCFWLYSSGSTGRPKGTVHLHSNLIQTAELYAVPTLGIHEADIVFSAAKLFFAYGLGNALTFPLAVGATAVLMAERPTPEAVFKRLRQHQPSIFYGVPTLYAAMLAHPDCPRGEELRLRCCVSAGEALPEAIGRNWSARMGVDILDGIGSTEMLHIFLSNRAGEVRYGTTGKPVPGYDIRLVGEDGQPVARGQMGELQVRGPSSALQYWNNAAKTRSTFLGEWTRSGDKYSVSADGYYLYAGRSDDMLKVGGIYVSPTEVEAALVTHDAVLEAAVVGREDEDRLIKPVAYVVLKAGHLASVALAEELKQHVKARLAAFKYPRWIEFIDELPKTATGKIQRFKLRAAEKG
ncbi:MAG TPA: benzoate-CoA ligase family protein [Burkholderiaceae bacterium]|nr:benzoate-CoA ligase family protein [Burkholderiaceae bacterium]